MRRAIFLLALAGLPLACGEEPDPLPPPTTEAGVQFGDGSEVWLQVSSGGGFVPEIFNLREVPSFLLFDDGRLIRPGAERESEPDLVPRFQQAQLDEATVAELVDAAESVVNGPDPGSPPVTDLPTTTIKTQFGRLDVYALGFDDGLTASQREARQAVTDLLDNLGQLGDLEPFEPDEWLVLTTATTEGLDLDPSANTVRWPLAADRAADADHPRVCTRVEGAEADEVLAALGTADQFTYVRTGRTLVEVALRPVLTGNESCTDAGEFVER